MVKCRAQPIGQPEETRGSRDDRRGVVFPPIRLPDGARARKVQLLTAGTTVAAQTATARCGSLPSVSVHEVIAIDF
ncbi:MAG TPA: hypothetical protein VNJ04_07075 [Gemmatimonadaceae bacterium]|nr:hypothetical protein [Gemmatimonadaceae bacterium]